MNNEWLIENYDKFGLFFIHHSPFLIVFPCSHLIQAVSCCYAKF